MRNSAVGLLTVSVILLGQTAFGAGAIVRDKRTNEGTVVAHKPTEADAIRDAKLAVGCGDDCEVVATFSNQCAAYAIDDKSKTFAFAKSASYDRAGEAAVEDCTNKGGSCRVMQTECDK